MLRLVFTWQVKRGVVSAFISLQDHSFCFVSESYYVPEWVVEDFLRLDYVSVEYFEAGVVQCWVWFQRLSD